ncbi:MAG: hypothetical protein GSR81_07130 [Desulfurococcales archaeon]|nr:hypothetical protein [Desulfurococcales archaeon]
MARELIVRIDGPLDPYYNMAFDEAMLYYTIKEKVAILRFYMWSQKTVTLGRRQPYPSVPPWKSIQVAVTRRITGGSSLLHVPRKELTYSIAIPSTHSFYKKHNIVSSAHELAKSIARALTGLGFNAHAPGITSQDTSRPYICLLGSGSADIYVEGKKVSGAAQYRERRGLLQHGVILLDYDHYEWTSVYKVDSKDEDALMNKITGLRSIEDVDLSSLIEEIIVQLSGLLDLEVSYSNDLVKLVHESMKLSNNYRDPRWVIQGEKFWALTI